MKKFKKLLLYLVIAAIVIIVGGISYITLALPNVGDAPDIHLPTDTRTIARGKYLANHVTLCVDCHSPEGPKSATELGAGGKIFDHGVGFPGKVQSPNITPYKLKDWTDGEIFRVITEGVRKDGSPLFPMMPYTYYSKMDPNDVYAIIAYLRTLKPVAADYPRAKLDFPLNILVHTMPQKAALKTMPPAIDTLAYGEYLTRSAACIQCHSPVNKGQVIAGTEFSGGQRFEAMGKVFISKNITPDKNTGIGSWSREAFVARFKAFTDSAMAVNPKAAKEAVNIMPWRYYSGMDKRDLEDIYDYLMTVKPVNHKVK